MIGGEVDVTDMVKVLSVLHRYLSDASTVYVAELVGLIVSVWPLDEPGFHVYEYGAVPPELTVAFRSRGFPEQIAVSLGAVSTGHVFSSSTAI